MERFAKNRTFTITFVGDSITWGLNHCTAEETYVACFAREVAHKFLGAKVIRYDGIVEEPQGLVGYEPVTVQEGTEGTIHIIRSGVGGNTVARAMARKQTFTGILPSKTRSDYILTMFGINDALYADPEKYVSAEVFKENYRKLLKLLKEDAPDAKIVVMTATTNDQSIEEHVKLTYELVNEENVGLIDMYALWQQQYDHEKEHFGYGDWLSDVSTDACHPTPKSAKIMGEKIFRELIGE